MAPTPQPDASAARRSPRPSQPDAFAGDTTPAVESPAARDRQPAEIRGGGERSLLRTDQEPVSDALLERLLRLRQPPLAVDHLISRGEVRQVTGYVDSLSPTELTGQQPSETYNSFRLAAAGTFGFGLQVWQLPDAQVADNHFERMRETHVVTGTTRVAGERAFRAELAGIRQFVFVSPRRAQVVALSCDEVVCTEPRMLQDLAQRIHDRL